MDGRIESGDYFMLCEGTWIENWWKANPRPIQQKIHLDAGMLALWQQLNIEHHRRVQDNSELIHHLLCALCLSLDRLPVDSGSREDDQGHSNEIVMLMRRYINEHALRPLRVKDVAEAVGLSVSRAVHLFKKLTGYTIIHYAQEIRLSNALEQIRYTDLGLEHIAGSCGFGTYSYFHKVFKARYGLSPSEVRSRPLAPGLEGAFVTAGGNSSLPGLSPDARRFLTS